jgi:hypothetical protein
MTARKRHINLRTYEPTARSASRSTNHHPRPTIQDLLARLAGKSPQPFSSSSPRRRSGRYPAALARKSRLPDHPRLPRVPRPSTRLLRYLHPPGARPVALPVDDPARLLHDEAQRHREMLPITWPRVRPRFTPSPRRAGRAATKPALRTSSGDWLARSPALPACRSSPTPAPRASTPAC